ncbi:MAG: hypothetical protein ACFFAL_10530 [Promethearchaeota archaeon]
MALGGFDFIAEEKDAAKKIEELAQVLERVATIFLNGVGSLEKQLNEMRTRLSRVETQVDTLLKMGGARAPSAPATIADAPTPPASAPPGPGIAPPPSPGAPAIAPGMAAPPPQTPTSPMAATGGLGIRAQMQGELQSFLTRRRAALEASLRDEE